MLEQGHCPVLIVINIWHWLHMPTWWWTPYWECVCVCVCVCECECECECEREFQTDKVENFGEVLPVGKSSRQVSWSTEGRVMSCRVILFNDRWIPSVMGRKMGQVYAIVWTNVCRLCSLLKPLRRADTQTTKGNDVTLDSLFYVCL
jgi:hypothetical protein